jgi:nucleobase:cation symporter-1, NCS1 family
MTDTSRTGGALVEQRSIDYVPAAERHGAAWQQAPFWFLGNLVFLTVAIGFIGPSLGLSLGWTILAAALGPFFGSLFTAFHASQGPVMGLPQMIQSRAQFGYRGVLLPLVGAAFAFTAFNLIDVAVISSGLHHLYGWNHVVVGIAVSVFGVLLAVFGHDWIHTAFRWILYVSLPCYLVLTIGIVAGGAGGTHVSDPGGFSFVAFMAQFAATASFSITYACYISDYTRYLPSNTSSRRLIAFVFCGAAVPVWWLVGIGAWLAIHLNASDALVALREAADNVVPGTGDAFAILAAITLAATIGLNGYSGTLTVMTGIDSVKPFKPTPTRRIAVLLVLAVVWTAIGISLPDNYLTALNNILAFMLFLLVPWTAVNLVDYFFVRRGHYALTELFKPNGLYGTWGWRGLTAFIASLIAMVPFMSVPSVFTGPAADAMNGIDISFIVGLIAGGGLYFILSRSLDVAAESGAVAASRRELDILVDTGFARPEEAPTGELA